MTDLLQPHMWRTRTLYIDSCVIISSAATKPKSHVTRPTCMRPCYPQGLGRRQVMQMHANPAASVVRPGKAAHHGKGSGQGLSQSVCHRYDSVQVRPLEARTYRCPALRRGCHRSGTLLRKPSFLKLKAPPLAASNARNDVAKPMTACQEWKWPLPCRICTSAAQQRMQCQVCPVPAKSAYEGSLSI